MTSLMQQLTWYLAGPMSGIKDSNYPAFAEACVKLRGMGYTIKSPHETYPNPQAAGDDYLRCLQHDVGTLSTCSGIILLPGWSKSNGAKLELKIALALQWPIRYYGFHIVQDIS